MTAELGDGLQPPARRKGRSVTSGPPDQPILTGSEKALAEEVVTLLKPILAEIDQKLDSIGEKMEALLAELTRTTEAAARLADRGDSRQAPPLADHRARESR
jgi:hypothetical protein